MRRLSVPGAKVALASGLLCFLLIQAFSLVAVQRRHPDYFDPEFAARLRLLTARRAEQPDRPTVVFLGSSQTVMAVRPEAMADLPEVDGHRPLPFNCGHIGGGPIANRMIYHRLCRAGLRPDRVVVEVMPTYLTGNVTSFVTTFMRADDLPVLAEHVEPFKLGKGILSGWLPPCHRFRGQLLRDNAPDWQTEPQPGVAEVRLGPLGGDDHWWTVDTVAPDDARRRLEEVRAKNALALQHFVINPRATAAWDALLDDCRRDGVPVLLVLLPVGETLRSWYSPQARSDLDAWCRDLSRRHDVPVVDLRDWLTDADFCDSQHALYGSGNAFSRRFGAEVVAPFVVSSSHRSGRLGGRLANPA